MMNQGNGENIGVLKERCVRMWEENMVEEEKEEAVERTEINKGVDGNGGKRGGSEDLHSRRRQRESSRSGRGKRSKGVRNPTKKMMRGEREEKVKE